MNKKILTILILAILGSVVSAFSATKQPLLIHWSQTTPDTTALKEHYAYWESYLPFDGIVLSINKKQYSGRYGETRANSLDIGTYWPPSVMVFSNTPLIADDYVHAIDNLKNTPFQKFKHNFVLVQLYTPYGSFPFEWFNDAKWKIVLDNIKVLAKVAKEGGAEGFMFDIEQYRNALYWDYTNLVNRLLGLGIIQNLDNRSFEDYRTKVRQRGAEFIEAINSVFPDVKFMVSFGSSLLKYEVDDNPAVTVEDPTASRRSLLAAFVDGLIFGADPGTEIIDGFELSYRYKKLQQFQDGLALIKTGSKEVSATPEFYAKKIKAAFGLFLTEPGEFGVTDVTLAVENGLKTTDEYLWTWSEKVSYWIKPGELPIVTKFPSVDFIGETPNTDNVLPIGETGITQEEIDAIQTGKQNADTYLQNNP